MKSQPSRAATEEQEPFNAGDADQVKERGDAAKRNNDLRSEGLRYIMADRRGRAYMRSLLVEKLFTRVGAKRPAGIFTGNSTTFYNAALKELGDIVAAELAAITPEEFRLLEGEF